jgi:ubiquinone/menaquinone biosynthesis C-methylase UbiE
MAIAENILRYYNLGLESSRLSGISLERLRTESILRRLLPQPPAVILDVGGGDGVYAFPLAEAGYEIHLVDPVRKHIEQAQQRSHSSGAQLKSIKIGDARGLEFADNFADAVISLGPMYHLQDAADRSAALREAWRVLKPGGTFLAAYISRFASLMDGVRQGFIREYDFAAIVEQDLKTGRRHNPTSNPIWFTDAYFHHPDEAKAEAEQAGFTQVQLLAVEGPLWLAASIDNQLATPAIQTRLLEFLERIECEETLVGASAHFIATGQKPRK